MVLSTVWIAFGYFAGFVFWITCFLFALHVSIPLAVVFLAKLLAWLVLLAPTLNPKLKRARSARAITTPSWASDAQGGTPDAGGLPPALAGFIAMLRAVIGKVEP